MHNTSTLLYSNKNLRQAPAQPGQQRATIGLTEYTRFTARNGCFGDHGTVDRCCVMLRSTPNGDWYKLASSAASE
ncbi:hypothetical protein TYRP_016585 [Tyrophagus putrescentiae]|nr:hypothetical protein TYRP_016585 [Tyrophagus putrescentiae]